MAWSLREFDRVVAAARKARRRPGGGRMRGMADLLEKCGVAAVHGHAEAANLVYLALYALQHRGQEAAGIGASDGGDVRRAAGRWLGAEVFTP